ncbi:pilus assembly protein [Granulicella sp. WH15]|nr:pilus assembly protein [Granulicella sp. WH15]
MLETALLLPMLLLLLVVAVDLGRAYYVAMEVSSSAYSGAQYGTQNMTDTAGMVAASSLDAPDLPTLTPVAKYGCECSDGSQAVDSCVSPPTCTLNVVNYVEVDTSVTYVPILPYPGLTNSLLLQGKARMRVSR